MPSRVLVGDYRATECPSAALVLTDPPYNLGKVYDGSEDTTPFHNHVESVVEWSKAGWTLILGPFPSMREWLHLIPPPERLLLWHRTFVLPRRGLKTWTESLTPILVYRNGGVWYGKTGNQRDQHDVIDAHSNMGDVQRLKKLGIVYKHPAATGTALPLRLIPLLTAPGDLVVDPFAGCGSILVAGQRLERKVAGVELSAKYADSANLWLEMEADNDRAAE